MPRTLIASLLAAMTLLTGGSPAVSQPAQAARLVAITFDDLPFANASAIERAEAVEANRAIRRTLVRRRVPATGFVTEDNVRALGPDGPAILRGWLRDGLDLGNHGATHTDINDLDAAAIRREIVDGEATFLPLARLVVSIR